MFVRIKKVENRKYLQVVENKYVGGKIKQRVICTLGRLDKLREKGHIEGIIRSLAKFSQGLKVDLLEVESLKK